MKQARQAPVFKPLSNTESISLFNFESQSTNIRPVRQIPFVNTNEQNRVAHHQDTGTERLSSLHAKLHQEADKIRKWKVQTEIELKQKEKKIHEASTTNESLRKSILELQLQNENLSLKLQEEMVNREDVVQRIGSTRQLCNILKDHAVKLEEQLHQCETERTELKYLEKEHLQQFEELSDEFKRLRITSTDKQNQLVNQLQTERDNRKVLEEELESKLSEAEVQLKVLMDQCDEKDIEIRDVRTMLQRNDEKIHTLEQSIATLQEEMKKSLADIESKENNLEAASEKLVIAEKEKLCFKERLSEISDKLVNLQMEKSTVEQSMVSSCSEYDAKLADLQQEINTLTVSLQKETEKVRHYEEQLVDMSLLSENLKSSRDILTLQKTELEGKVALLSNDSFVFKIDYQRSIDEHKEKYSALKAELEKNIEEIENLKEDIQSAVSQMKEIQNKLEVSQANSNEIQQPLDGERQNMLNLKTITSHIKQEVERKLKLISSQESSINNMKKDHQKLQNDFDNAQDEIQSLKKDLEKLEEEKEQLTEKSHDLQDQIQALKYEQHKQDISVDSAIKAKSNQICELETKLKELKGEVTSKNKQIRDNEKEIKGLKSKFNMQVKTSESKDKEISQLTEQIEKLTIHSDKLQSDIDTLNQQLVELKASEQKAVEKMKEMETKHDQAQREKMETERKCDYELAEMMATVEKYKKENNKIVQQKEKEIEMLKSRSEQTSAQKQKRESDFEEIKKATEDMKASLDVALAEKSDITSKLSHQVQVVENLEKKIVSKDTEIKELKENVKLLKKQTKIKTKSSTVQTQTTPVPSPSKETMTPNLPKEDIATDHESETSLKTPQRSILRNTNSVSKRRKVAFASHDDSGRHSASDSDSSTELMEVEPESIDSRYKTSCKSTPLLIRPSPKVNPSPKAVKVKRTETPVPMTRIPRGPPVKISDKKWTSKTESIVREEREMFKELFPNKQLEKKDDETSHVRKTPSKSTAKFFKASPKERLLKKAKHAGTEDIAWFDLDSVFGFGPED